MRVPRSSPDSSGLRGPPRASTSTGLPRSRAPPQRPSSHSCPLSPVRPSRVAPASYAQPRETSAAHSLPPGRRQQLKTVTRKESQCRLQEGVLRSHAGIQGLWSELNSALHPHKGYVHLEPVNVILYGKRVFAAVVKDLEMRSSQIFQPVPKSNDEHPYRKRT